MSWIKRRGPSTPSPAPGPPVQMYNPNQHSTQETQWQNQQLHDNWYSHSQQQHQPVTQQEPQTQLQQYWQQSYTTPHGGYNQNAQQQPPQQQQQYTQQYQNQSGYYQTNTGYNQQAYGNQQYNQQYNQNNLYPNTNTPQQGGQQNEGDAWNWGWGDEDNSNVQLMSQQPPTNNVNQAGNNIGDAFAKDESWNWGVDDTKPIANPVQNIPIKEEPTDVDTPFPKMEKNSNRPAKVENDSESIKPIPPQDLLKVSGKRGKLETPQWSTESQMSQESSDDILHTSESDKSHIMSRSSTISHSPLSGQEQSQNLDDVPSQNNAYYEDLASNHQFENKEIVPNIKAEVQENRPPKANPTPPPPKNTQTPPLLPPGGPADDGKNPYKRSTGLSHKVANKFRASNTTPPESRQNLYQPNFHSQQVNLETLPDNSEQPDPVPSQPVQKSKPIAPWPDNNEAPINDRNQYLETGQLSGANSQDYSQGDANIKQEANDTLPPPGLRRMVPGQMEQNESSSSAGNFGDEPPPGLSRMVLGQTGTVSNPQLNSLPIDEEIRLQYEATGPPEGLRRMVPGESSSPESTLRIPQQRRDENDSESELDQLSQHVPQRRSATIGADTPPAVSNSPNIQPATLGANRSETIGGGDSTASNQDGGRTSSTSAASNNKSDKTRKSKPDKKESIDQKSRRDSIEGETQESEVSKLTNSVRNLTVGENLTDGHTSNTSLPEPSTRRLSRQESSDSDKDVKKLSRNSREKRSAEKIKRDKDREREKYRYSPDSYRDKKYDRRRYKDRRYEEDTDYFSDKEKDRRVRDDREREYDRKYSSLRKDKDKDRRRRDPREYGRDRREDYYYRNRYDDDYEPDNRSRPSSRSDSMHESYRGRDPEKDRRHRDRERDRYRRHRDPRDMYNPYQGFAYDPYNPYYQQYQYYENLRRTNPQAYAEWYRKYYQQATGQASSYGGAEDRASVHSGRSSANDELAKDRYTRQSFYSQASVSHLGGYYGDTRTHSVSGQYGLDSSSFARPFDHTDSSVNFEDNSLVAQRLTPAKFATAHIKASIASGKLLRIMPHYPMDGQNAVVEVCNLQSLLVNDEEYKELSQFPGPLVKGVTHKKTIIEYCENKIRDANFSQVGDTESYVLMWELLILLIRQNGMVVGTDIAELLLKNKPDVPPRPSSVISNLSSSPGDVNPTSEASNYQSENNGSTLSVLKEEEVTNKFREFLLYGSGKEALEWAMRHGLWGHALFLASKLDKRTYANVMMRFANGLTLNDPLQTLYQLLSGKMPAAVTCVSDEKWGDWRPHLAMILSNSTQRPELNCKAITTLGDTLKNRGSLYAAQFCYLMAEVGFGKFDDPETRLALLGADHSRGFPSFVSNEAVHMTEIYEYACGLNIPDFIIPEFQIYKYLLATRLADYGLLEKSLQYLEKISAYVVNNPASVQPSFIGKVCSLADRLKFYDPVGEMEDESEFGGILETSRPDNSWLKDLRAVQSDYQSGLITHEVVNAVSYTASPLETDLIQQTYEPNGQETWQQQYDQQYQQSVVQQQQWQPEQQLAQVEYQQQEALQQNAQYQEQQNYWSNQQQQQQQQQWGEQLNQFQQESVDQQQNYYGSNAQVEETPQPQISMPNQSKGPSPYPDEPNREPSEKKPSPVKPKPQSPAQDKTQSTGWFGGIFSKLALKPKNQMKLPDDKNPKIVWDQDKKKWTNVDEDPSDPATEFKPPPKMADLMPKSGPSDRSLPGQVAEQPFSLPGGAVRNGSTPVANASAEEAVNAVKSNQPNMFKLQRGRNLKNSYVDVFNPGGKSGGPSSLPPIDNLPSAVPQLNFFIPQPVSDPNAPVDFLTPGGVPQMAEQQMSRWSSTSSLSREVQFYMRTKPHPR
ncbi:uncharacterized protein LOC108911173 isoform X2 [Anoplophora glabripennis]|uniref:uncharacterized protein LOC108911173 isoform X2 n=1 Tax=Anoplophora glabripennis TaxID=217634 RepID=UPI0008748AF6|nr:uncharacterized protein LOC108911173 isoform X2 [Anoplophora glabripennis]